ncbi:MFS transporter [Telmatospirillum sp.]|uniref:MFS transporter n=1 Tax=Telmatospirillum sp. TaxID=2079197 RepID=UPI00284BBFAB|nr:MFS transporter [Telmatospirillum sp.]MDR3436849.1 MFS transporter [Telmatospirillum sp.]
MANAPHFRRTALIVASALFMEQLDGTVLATALPSMAGTFHISPLYMSVALTSYLLSLAVFIPASGKIADRFGARRVFCTAIGIFIVGSLLCGQADSLPILVTARLLQGFGGALMVPVARLILMRSVSKEEMVSAMSWFLVPALIGPVMGPPLGGAIVSYLSWRWIFYINLPIGLIGMILALRYIEDTTERVVARFDWLGLVASGISLACLMFGLEMISRGVTSPFASVSLLGVGLVFGGAYLLHARNHPAPILDIGLMRIPTFRLSVIGGSLTRITGGALPFLLPMMMQLGFGMSAAQSGMITFMTAAGSLLMKASAPPILRRLGFRRTLVWNGLIATFSIAVCAAFRPSWPTLAIYAVLLVSGFFQSLQFTAYNTIAYADIPTHRISDATSFYTTFQQLMLSLGICVSAAALHFSVVLQGHQHAALSDFSAAFLTITAISLFASPVCARLPKDAGAAVSGHKAKS